MMQIHDILLIYGKHLLIFRRTNLIRNLGYVGHSTVIICTAIDTYQID